MLYLYVYVINKYLKLNKYKTKYKLNKNIVFFSKEIYTFKSISSEIGQKNAN